MLQIEHAIVKYDGVLQRLSLKAMHCMQWLSDALDVSFDRGHAWELLWLKLNVVDTWEAAILMCIV